MSRGSKRDSVVLCAAPPALRYPTLLLILLALLASATATAQEQVLVESASPMRYLANVTDPGLGLSWTAPTFIDSAWPSGSYGVGYETTGGAEELIDTAVPSGTLSVYTRAVVTIDDVTAVQQLELAADYDDGYALWINGQEVFRSPELPTGALDWNTPPVVGHESSNGVDPDHGAPNDLSTIGIPLLQNGTNVVAIAVWNQNATSSDLLLVPQLIVNRATSLTRRPYLQLGSSSEVTLRWRTDTPQSSRVVYGLAPGALSSEVVETTPVTEHELTLSGLAAQTRYFYAVGSIDALLVGNDDRHFFESAPASGNSEPTRIWVIGDSGRANDDARRVRSAYSDFTGDTHTDVWLLLGDNAYYNGTDAEYQQALFEIYPEFLRNTLIWPALGNHDIFDPAAQTWPYFDIFSLPQNGEAGGEASASEAYYSFDHANIHFVVLDSHTADRSPPPVGAMLSWLENDLAATTRDWIVAFWHHPPYSDGSHNSDLELRLIEMRENALPILESYGVDLVLNGHSHSYERSFLLDGHYGDSTTFAPLHVVDGGSGDADSPDGPYLKSSPPTLAHEGAVYTVAGSSSQVSPAPLQHPAMYIGLNALGSVVLDVNGYRLDAQFLGATGAVLDSFAIVKGLYCPLDPENDIDGDEVCGDVDNCPELANPDQLDSDGDGIGDLCDICPFDPDLDGDGICAGTDNCPGVANPGQADGDADGVGDLCDGCPTDPGNDPDEDGICAGDDNCPGVFNALQTDSDADGLGDYCDVCPSEPSNDGDGDGVCESSDSCPLIANPDQQDLDGDGLGDPCDLCPADADNDFDADTICGDLDNCPGIANPGQENGDADAFGDACDSPDDVDGDSVANTVDNCPLASNPAQQDGDGDGEGDACDSDDDNDGIPDVADCAPRSSGVAAAPGEIGPTLRMDKTDGGTVYWTRGIQGHASDVFRGSQPDGWLTPNWLIRVDIENPGTESIQAEDPVAGGLLIYLVGAVNVCGESALGQSSQSATRPAPQPLPTLLIDSDGDGVPNLRDNCAGVSNPGLSDIDSDFVGDLCDNCPATPNPMQLDGNGDGEGDACPGSAIDSDSDGVVDLFDNCPDDPNPDQLDDDADGSGNACDGCPSDPAKIEPGVCGCGNVDEDIDGSGTPDCIEFGLFSAADQQFEVGDAPTLISPITVVDDAVTARIKSKMDIRIRIPSTFNMTWDTSIDDVSLSGDGAGKVRTNLNNYEDGDRTLVLDVTADFDPGERVSFSGAAFLNFAATSPPDRLELEVDNDGVVADEDARTITIFPAATPVLFSADDQRFTIGDPLTQIEPITISEGLAPGITAIGDIRIRIPAGFNMSWDSDDTSATISGSGAGNVDTEVSYEDGGKTLVIDVTSDFSAGERITISALNFESFTAASPADRLELELGNDGVVSATDSRTITVFEFGISSEADQLFLVDDPATLISPITITDSVVTASITKKRDIRIRIPSSLDMRWDESVTAVIVGGSASGKVDVNLNGFENGARVLVLDVTEDFAPGDQVILSGARFINFNSPSSADRLELDINDDGVTDDEDDKTITIGSNSAAASAPPDQGAPPGRPPDERRPAGERSAVLQPSERTAARARAPDPSPRR